MSEKKIALVTGANKGIGFETARQLAQKGITVLLGARDETRGEDAAQKLREEDLDVKFVKVDVTDETTHDTTAKFIEETFGKLDILVNNAGIAQDYLTPASAGTLEQWRTTFETNVFGLVTLTQKLLPLIKKSEAGRIVNLSSSMGSITIHSDPQNPFGGTGSTAAYNASKAAVNMFTANLAAELRETNIKVNAADPGWVKTDMGGADAALEVTEGAKTSVELATLTDDAGSGRFLHLGKENPW